MDQQLGMDDRARFQQHQMRLQSHSAAASTDPMMFADYPASSSSSHQHTRSSSAGATHNTHSVFAFSHPQQQSLPGSSSGITHGNMHGQQHALTQSFYPFGGGQAAEYPLSMPTPPGVQQHQAHHQHYLPHGRHRDSQYDRPSLDGSMMTENNWLGLPPNPSGSMATTLNGGGMVNSPQVFTPGADDFDMKPDPESASWINDGFDELDGPGSGGEDERGRADRNGSTFFGMPDSPFGTGYTPRSNGNAHAPTSGSMGLNTNIHPAMIGIMPPRRKSADALMGMSSTYINDATFDQPDLSDPEDTAAFDDLIMAEAEAEAEAEAGGVTGVGSGSGSMIGTGLPSATSQIVRLEADERLKGNAVHSRNGSALQSLYALPGRPDFVSGEPVSVATSTSSINLPFVSSPAPTGGGPVSRPKTSKSKASRPPPAPHTGSAQSNQSIPAQPVGPIASSNQMHRSIDDLLVRFWTHQMEIAESGAEPEAMDPSNGINGAGGDGVAGPSSTKPIDPLPQSVDPNEVEGLNGPTVRQDEFKSFALPLARIKKVMKSDPEVKMISAEVPVLLAKACEIFIGELTCRAWLVAESYKRRTLQKSDVAAAIGYSDMFDFLIDIVPREEAASKHDIAQKKRNAKAKERRDEVKERDKDRERARAGQREREREAEEDEEPRRKQAGIGHQVNGLTSVREASPPDLIGARQVVHGNGVSEVHEASSRETPASFAAVRPPRSSSAPPSQSVRPEAPPQAVRVKAEVGA